MVVIKKSVLRKIAEIYITHNSLFYLPYLVFDNLMSPYYSYCSTGRERTSLRRRRWMPRAQSKGLRGKEERKQIESTTWSPDVKSWCHWKHVCNVFICKTSVFPYTFLSTLLNELIKANNVKSAKRKKLDRLKSLDLHFFIQTMKYAGCKWIVS